MAAGSKALTGYGKLEPLRQGSLDRLCGLYSIINAIALAAYPVKPLPPRQRQLLFDHGINFLAQNRRLEMANLEGMNERLWTRLRNHIVAVAEMGGAPSLTAIPLFPGGRPSCLDHAVRAITDSIDGGAPVLLVLWGVYDHCTVVAGYSPSNLLLFDSGGFRRVAIRSLALRRPHHEARHKLTWRSTAAILTQT